MMPLVSVIIPVYNVKLYLCECVDSVINQTYKNIEIILIDDGSTDGSGTICDVYRKKDDRIRVIHQKNNGLSAARNSGLKIMRGNIVAFLDSDDAFMPQMLEIMVNRMKRSQSDIVLCGYSICYTNTIMLKSKVDSIIVFENEVMLQKEALIRLIERKINIHVWNKLYRSELFQNTCFTEGRVFEDQLLMPYLFEKANIVETIDQTLVFHRKHNSSITSTYSEKIVLDLWFALKKKELFISSRTPEIFTPKQNARFREVFFHSLISSYSHMLSGTTAPSRQATKIIDREISQKVKNISSYSLKTRIMYCLYKINPCFCSIVLNIHSLIRRKIVSVSVRTNNSIRRLLKNNW